MLRARTRSTGTLTHGSLEQDVQSHFSGSKNPRQLSVVNRNARTLLQANHSSARRVDLHDDPTTTEDVRIWELRVANIGKECRFVLYVDDRSFLSSYRFDSRSSAS